MQFTQRQQKLTHATPKRWQEENVLHFHISFLCKYCCSSHVNFIFIIFLRLEQTQLISLGLAFLKNENKNQTFSVVQNWTADTIVKHTDSISVKQCAFFCSLCRIKALVELLKNDIPVEGLLLKDRICLLQCLLDHCCPPKCPEPSIRADAPGDNPRLLV